MIFLKNVLSSLVAIWLAIVLFVLVGFGIAIVASKDAVKEIKSNSVLEINMMGELNDYAPMEINPLSEILGFDAQTYGFNAVCKAIESATYDDRIKGISLRNIPENIGWAQITALRKMLDTFKQEGKFVYAYDDVYSQKKYYLNSIADSLYISPLGYVELKGLHSEVLFYKDFQEKYGVKMEVIRHGKYKSAVEPFIANEMSPANREQISELITSLWQEVDTSVKASRDIDVEDAVMNLYGKSSESALEHHLIDAIVYEDAYGDMLKKKLGKDELRKVSFSDYIMQTSLMDLIEEKSKIAVVYAQGEIIYGQGELTKIAPDKMIKALDKAAKDKDVKAIVFRINSPGGSALASDLIWRAVENARKEKPVIVSMGNLAASGGYYIACAADKIYAEPTTITGSIGVFGVLPNAAELSENIGIHSQVVSTHNNGMHYSAMRPVDERFKNVVKESIENIYDVFLQRVADGRGMTKEKVNEIAQGRVWTGASALEIGLIDELGSLDDAIAYAASQVELKEYSIMELPNYEIDFKKMIGLSPFIKAQIGIEEILPSELVDKAASLKNLFETKSTQARMPFEMKIE
ncbi:signal peptide peptidase SppA [Wenyingzhuangia sp. 2_MG-2023]|uniref:signal peptide peptidase SppA n=1 Tax=Wenyingzhuangia sp. 2_MG-2023 TaxID=3062639 RepID=UPI0026E1D4CA|nr:signal peptide peptidase SppA [Wenyingzhuangia sp. 2_MG-2023]MDO6737870.1 signal peptide peptidase SppA [Wenyingzhuangia sp. 2_MG-2023]